MKYYKIIQDRVLLQEFVESLPMLNKNEKFYCSLFARKKYDQDLIKSNDKTQLKRFLATKENLIHKISQLEIPFGAYKLKDVDASLQSLVLYIHLNPRCMKKATKLMGKKCWDLLHNDNFNIHQEAMSCIQKSKSKNSRYVIFDIDSKDEDLSLIKEILPSFKCSSEKYKELGVITPYKILNTRGGYHLIVNTKWIEQYNHNVHANPKNFPKGVIKNWYMQIKNTFKSIDEIGDIMSPIPGTVQGGFTPCFNKKY